MKVNIPAEIEAAINNPDVPKIYSNSFACALGIGDSSILFKNGNKPVCLLNLSYTTAKTLAIKLQGLIVHLENASGNKIMTTDDIVLFFKEDSKPMTKPKVKPKTKAKAKPKKE